MGTGPDPSRAPRSSRRAGTVALDTHRPLEAAIGLALVAIPLLFGLTGAVDFSTLAILVAVVVGGLITLLGFAGTRQGDLFSPTTHAAYDRALAVILVVAAVLFAIAGDVDSTILLGLAAVLYAALVLSTRYTRR